MHLARNKTLQPRTKYWIRETWREPQRGREDWVIFPNAFQATFIQKHLGKKSHSLQQPFDLVLTLRISQASANEKYMSHCSVGSVQRLPLDPDQFSSALLRLQFVMAMLLFYSLRENPGSSSTDSWSAFYNVRSSPERPALQFPTMGRRAEKTPVRNWHSPFLCLCPQNISLIAAAVPVGIDISRMLMGNTARRYQQRKGQCQFLADCLSFFPSLPLKTGALEGLGKTRHFRKPGRGCRVYLVIAKGAGN